MYVLPVPARHSNKTPENSSLYRKNHEIPKFLP